MLCFGVTGGGGVSFWPGVELVRGLGLGFGVGFATGFGIVFVGTVFEDISGLGMARGGCFRAESNFVISFGEALVVGLLSVFEVDFGGDFTPGSVLFRPGRIICL